LGPLRHAPKSTDPAPKSATNDASWGESEFVTGVPLSSPERDKSKIQRPERNGDVMGRPNLQEGIVLPCEKNITDPDIISFSRFH
jgi:hypothetical protein